VALGFRVKIGKTLGQGFSSTLILFGPEGPLHLAQGFNPGNGAMTPTQPRDKSLG